MVMLQIEVRIEQERVEIEQLKVLLVRLERVYLVEIEQERVLVRLKVVASVLLRIVRVGVEIERE